MAAPANAAQGRTRALPRGRTRPRPGYPSPPAGGRPGSGPRALRLQSGTTQEKAPPQTKPAGQVLKRPLGLAHLGGATLDNEETYLLKKLYTALGVVQVENQARI